MEGTGQRVARPGALSLPDKKPAGRFSLESVGGFVAIVGCIVAWHVASLYAPAYAIPGWSRIFDALLGISLVDVGISVARLAVSMALSFVVGVAFATVAFESRVFEALTIPVVKLMMAIPAVCWVVFSILWFKGVEFRIFFVMCVTCMPVFIIDSLDAMKGVPLDLRQMVSSFRPDKLQYYAKVIFPGITPNLLTSWKINLTLAIRVVTIAELVGAVTGIGHGLVMAQERFSVADVFAWTLVLVMILYVLQGIVSVLERRALRWRHAAEQA